MKKVVLLLLLVVPLVAFGQIEMTKDSFPTYQGIIKVEGKSQKEIYSALKSWVADNFNSAQNVIQLDDAESGKLTLKALTSFKYPLDKLYWNGRLNYTITFDVKDSRFRATIEYTNSWSNLGSGDNFLLLIKSPEYEGSVPFLKKADEIQKNFMLSLSKIPDTMKQNADW